ncbi:MAG: aminodeoxychorismate synthase component I [Verrucomicrobia bacterium]|nr:aminodeoxychorismate synthase component I [Verrucomicrobiota bacterium]
MEPFIQLCPGIGSAFEAFWKLRWERHVAFLDSALPDAGLGRLSVVASDPVLVFSARGDKIEMAGGTARGRRSGNPFAALRELEQRFCAGDGGGEWPHGALIGCFGYGLRQFVERVPARVADDVAIPDAWFGVYDRLLVFDHDSGRATIISTGVDESGRADLDRARRRADEWQRKLAVKMALPPGGSQLLIPVGRGVPPSRATVSPVRPFRLGGTPRPTSPEQFGGEPALQSNLTRADYEQAVRRILDYIAAGDAYQINFSQRFRARTAAEPALLYHALRTANPAPFAAYLDCGAGQILSSSPERFLQIRGRSIQTRPIKGTRPRTGNEQADQKAARELMMSTKDHAELLMITDLERNDLGRVCKFGSVHVPELVTLESYATVLHLVSTVEGRLADGVTAVDAICACFPGGSITGAPKIRAMEIIDELEPSARGVYTGAIGYLGFNGVADLNIAIRTMVYENGVVHFHAGGGIVADSEPALEYEETLHKVRGMVQALEQAEAMRSASGERDVASRRQQR